MKKWICLICALVFVLSFAACGTSAADSKPANEPVPNKWGITLEAENVSSSGLTLVCRQSGGENVAELSTGSYFAIQKRDGAEWIDVEYAPQAHDIAWTLEAWIIPAENEVSWDVNWAWLYGELNPGEYRIGKDITNFKGPGVTENETVYAAFTID